MEPILAVAEQFVATTGNIDKNVSFKISISQVIDGKRVICPKCPICDETMIRLENEKLNGNFLVCPEAIQVDDEGNQTGRLHSLAHCPILFDSTILGKQIFRPGNDDRSMYIPLSCSKHRQRVVAPHVLERLNNMLTDDEKDSAEYAGLYKLIKVNGTLGAKMALVANDDDKKEEYAKCRVEFMRRDVVACNLIDKIVSQKFKAFVESAGAKAKMEKDSAGPSGGRKFKFSKPKMEGRALEPMTLILDSTNANVKISICWTKGSICCGRYTCHCCAWNCGNNWSMLSDLKENYSLIYASCLRPGAKSLPQGSDSNEDIVRNCIPYTLIQTYELKDFLHPDEYTFALYLRNKKMDAGESMFDEGEITSDDAEPRFGKRPKLNLDIDDSLLTVE